MFADESREFEFGGRWTSSNSLDSSANMVRTLRTFPSQKLNSNGTLRRDPREYIAAFYQKIPSISVVQFKVQMSKLNGIGKTHQERIFVVELKLKLRSLFHYEQIARENSDIK